MFPFSAINFCRHAISNSCWYWHCWCVSRVCVLHMVNFSRLVSIRVSRPPCWNNELIGPWEMWRQFCKYIFQTHFTRIDVFSTSCEICLRWVPHDPIDDKSTLDQVMAWCRQATSHYMRKCWPRSLLPYCVTRHSESIMICWFDLKLTMSKNMPSQGAGDSAETTLKNHVKLPVVITGFYTSGKSRSYYDMARVVRPSVNDIWLSTEVTTCQINFNFTDIMHLVRPVHDTGNGPCSSLKMCLLTQLLLFASGHFWGRFSSESLQIWYSWSTKETN